MSKQSKVKEPLFHIARRKGLSQPVAWGYRIGSVAAALIVCAIVIVAFTGENPLGVYKSIFEGAVGTTRRIWGTLQNLAMLLCVSLAVTPAFKMKFWNLGAEGQVLIGGLATAMCMMYFGNTLPTPILMIVMVAVSMLAGAVWAVIPAVFKALWNTNESLFTLMMNYIAIQFVSYFCLVKAVPAGSGQIGIINSTTNAGWFPTLFNQPYFVNVVIVALLTVVMYIYLKYSKHGYEISVVGESENTARYIGINVKKVIIRTLILSGALCGITGLLLVGGTDHTITRDTAAGRGFTAIMVSWLGKFNPIYMVLTSFIIVFLQKGSISVATEFGLNTAFSDIITGIIIFFIIGSEFFINYKVIFNKKNKEVESK
ncbi:MAG: ABC transporter permease [Oscillospiraceae bacterium]|nr:ABC transporter permease [Oscillospiraceae bacterium]